MKICTKCKSEKDENDFADKSNGRKQSHCKECGRGYGKAHYRANKSAYFLRNKQRKLEQREGVWIYLSERQCIDCGEDETLLLDFDHRDPTKKEFTIGSVLAMGSKTWAQLLAEMEKCDIRCVVCHRRRTAVQYGWWKVDQRSSNGRTPDFESVKSRFES